MITDICVMQRTNVDRNNRNKEIKRRNMFSDQLDTRQLDAIYHSETRFRWKYVSEMASSVCYNVVANIFERLAKRSIVVVTCEFYNRHNCKLRYQLMIMHFLAHRYFPK